MTGAERDRYSAIHAGFVAGDAAALASNLGGGDWLNTELPEAFGGGHVLVYAIYWSPPPFIAWMIAEGAEVNFAADDGFPALLAALSRDRPPRHEVLATLLANGADVDARGINDWTPLHYAVSLHDAVAIRMLLAAGADPSQRTRIDQYSTALDDARAMAFDEAVGLLEATTAGGSGGI